MKRALTLALLALALTAIPVVAIAAPATVEWQQVDVTMHEEQGRSVLIISGRLPEGTKLPATVQLSAPKGAEIMWAGEIVGTGAENDIEATPQKSSGEDFDAYSFTLTKAPVGQIEVVPPNATTFDGTTYATAVKWVSPTNAEEVRLNALMPAGAKLAEEVEGTELVPGGEPGTNYLSKTFTKVKAGKPLELAFNYTVAAAAPATGQSTTASNSPILIIVLLAAGALFVGAFLAIRRKTALMRGEEYEVDEAGDYAPAAALAVDAPGADEAVSDIVEDSGADADEEHVPARTRSRAPMAIVFAVVGVIMVFVVIAGYRSVTPQTAGGAISRTFGTGEACTQASIAVKPNDGVNLAESANDVLGVFATVPGVTTASLYVDEGRVEVGYCDSSANEDMLRQALASSGLVTAD